MPNVRTNYAEGHVAKCPALTKRREPRRQHTGAYISTGTLPALSPPRTQRWVMGTLRLEGPPGTGRADPMGHLWAWNCPSPVWFLFSESRALEQGNYNSVTVLLECRSFTNKGPVVLQCQPLLNLRFIWNSRGKPPLSGRVDDTGHSG